ncbi:hypothetical protein V8C40DRAFT_229716 [Trichoderma camerunense]
MAGWFPAARKTLEKRTVYEVCVMAYHGCVMILLLLVLEFVFLQVTAEKTRERNNHEFMDSEAALATGQDTQPRPRVQSGERCG